MCYEAKLLDGRLVETVGELKKDVPIIVYDSNYRNPVPDDCCLCCVDFEKTAEANNLSVELDLGSQLYSFQFPSNQ